MSKEHKVVETGCSFCQKHLGTVEQFKRHITDDVLPPLLDKLSSESSAMGTSPSSPYMEDMYLKRTTD